MRCVKWGLDCDLGALGGETGRATPARLGAAPRAAEHTGRNRVEHMVPALLPRLLLGPDHSMVRSHWHCGGTASGQS